MLNKLFKPIMILSALLMFSSSLQAKEWKKVRIGVEGAYRPFSFYTADGELSGFDIDISKALCDAMNVECEFVASDWDGIIPGLLAGKFDMIVASLSITEERKKVVAFSDKYYKSSGHFLIPRKDSLNIVMDGLGGSTVGVQRGTTHANFLEDMFKDKVNIVQYDTQENVILDLFAGRLDAIVADSFVLLGQVLQTEKGNDYQFIGPSLNDKRWFGEGEAGIAFRKEDKDLREMVNRAILKIRDNGEYRKVNDKYFPFDIYDK